MDNINYFRKFLTRSSLANGLMVMFIVGTTIGAGMIMLPAGFIVGGVTCGLYGFLLGNE